MVDQKSLDLVPPPHRSAKYNFIACLFNFVTRFLCLVNFCQYLTSFDFQIFSVQGLFNVYCFAQFRIHEWGTIFTSLFLLEWDMFIHDLAE